MELVSSNCSHVDAFSTFQYLFLKHFLKGSLLLKAFASNTYFQLRHASTCREHQQFLLSFSKALPSGKNFSCLLMILWTEEMTHLLSGACQKKDSCSNIMIKFWRWNEKKIKLKMAVNFLGGSHSARREAKELIHCFSAFLKLC